MLACAALASDALPLCLCSDSHAAVLSRCRPLTLPSSHIDFLTFIPYSFPTQSRPCLLHRVFALISTLGAMLGLYLTGAFVAVVTVDQVTTSEEISLFCKRFKVDYNTRRQMQDYFLAVRPTHARDQKPETRHHHTRTHGRTHARTRARHLLLLHLLLLHLLFACPSLSRASPHWPWL